MASKRGYLKIHVAVDIKNKKIVSLEVTSEEIHDDGKMLKRLVDNASENNNVKSLLADDICMIAIRISYIYQRTILHLV